MVTRNTSFASGEHYHIYNRGNSKQKIFLADSDFERFKVLLYISNTSKQFNIRDLLKSRNNIFEIKKPDELVQIGVYCLMPNHFHLVLSPLIDEGISKFMLKLGTAYTMYFNTKYERSGSLYEGRYKAKYIDSDEYLKYLFSYIHLNPIVAPHENDEHLLKEKVYVRDAYQKAASYPHSSLKEYMYPSPRAALGLASTDIFRTYFRNEKNVEEELFNWLELDPQSLALGPRAEGF